MEYSINEIKNVMFYLSKGLLLPFCEKVWKRSLLKNVHVFKNNVCLLKMTFVFIVSINIIIMHLYDMMRLGSMLGKKRLGPWAKPLASEEGGGEFDGFFDGWRLDDFLMLEWEQINCSAAQVQLSYQRV